MPISSYHSFKYDFTIVALIAFRNEELYLDICLRYLINQGILVYLINNDSQDDSVKIAKTFLNKGVITIDQYPFAGVFEHGGLLNYKHQITNDLDANWFIHHDADEIFQAPEPHLTLFEGIRAADTHGYNTINFDEFVFIPIDGENYEGQNYVEEMRNYYFFEPKPQRQHRAWKKQPNTINPGAGHRLTFPGQQIYPQNFILRHYIILSTEHAIRKYANRIFPQKELDMGWHNNRVQFTPDKLDLSYKPYLKKLADDGRFDRSEPVRHHEFLGDLPDKRYN